MHRPTFPTARLLLGSKSRSCPWVPDLVEGSARPQEGWMRVTGAGADSEEKPHEQGRAQKQGVGKLCDEIVV